MAKEEIKEEDKKTDENPEEPKEGEEGAEGAAPKKFVLDKKKKMMLGGAAAVLVIIIAAVFFLTGKKSDAPEAEEQAAAQGAGHGDPHAPLAEGDEMLTFYELEPFLVNLNSASRQQSYLKLTVQLQLENDQVTPQIEHSLPLIRDSFQVFLRELTPDDIRGSAGIYTLREELLLRINKVLAPAKVEDILFKEILVQ